MNPAEPNHLNCSNNSYNGIEQVQIDDPAFSSETFVTVEGRAGKFKHIKSVGKGLRNFFFGRSEPEEQSAEAAFIKKLPEDEIDSSTEVVTKAAYSQAQKTVTKFQDACGKRQAVYEKWKTKTARAKNHTEKIAKKYKKAEIRYQVAQQQLNTSCQVLKRLKENENFRASKIELYKAYLGDHLNDKFSLHRLFYEQQVPRPETAGESTISVIGDGVSFVNFVLPGMGTAASLGCIVGESVVKYALDKCLYDESKKIIQLYQWGKPGRQKKADQIIKQTSAKMNERFQDHLASITPESIKELSKYNVKQMMSYAVEKHNEIRSENGRQWNPDYLTSLLVMGTLYAKRKGRGKEVTIELNLEVPNEKWCVMDLMRRTALWVEAENQMYLPPENERSFIGRLQRQKYKCYRHSLQSPEAIREEIQICSLTCDEGNTVGEENGSMEANNVQNLRSFSFTTGRFTELFSKKEKLTEIVSRAAPQISSHFITLQSLNHVLDEISEDSLSDDDEPAIGVKNLLESALLGHKPSYEELQKQADDEGQKDPDALYAMGILLEKGVTELEKNPQLQCAIEYYKRAATEGSLEAKDRLRKEGPFMLKKSGKYEEVTAEDKEDYYSEVIVKGVDQSVQESFAEALELEARLIKWKIILKNVEIQRKSKK